MQLRNSRVLVTGASRGLGKNIAQAMARRGADVALVARNAEQLEELAKELGGKAYPADLMDPAAVEALIGRVEADGPVDVIINNAGVDRVGRFWNAACMATRPGLKAVDLFRGIGEGRIKALWVMATNPVVSLPNADRVRAALEKCELVIVSDCIADTDTMLTIPPLAIPPSLGAHGELAAR